MSMYVAAWLGARESGVLPFEPGERGPDKDDMKLQFEAVPEL